MVEFDLRSRINICKTGILILGLAILGVGLHSHFQSSWVKPLSKNVASSSSIWYYLKLYQYCDLKAMYPDFKDRTCPSINLENYFVTMIVISFITSLLGFIALFLRDLELYPWMLTDMGYHGVSAVLLLVAGILYIVSAVQIDNFFGYTDAEKTFKELDFKKLEKIIAGVLTMFQACIYGGVAGLIAVGGRGE